MQSILIFVEHVLKQQTASTLTEEKEATALREILSLLLSISTIKDTSTDFSAIRIRSRTALAAALGVINVEGFIISISEMLQSDDKEVSLVPGVGSNFLMIFSSLNSVH